MTAKGKELEERMDLFERDKRIKEARERLGTNPDLTPEKLARLYQITVAELMGEMTDDR